MTAKQAAESARLRAAIQAREAEREDAAPARIPLIDVELSFLRAALTRIARSVKPSWVY